MVDCNENDSLKSCLFYSVMCIRMSFVSSALASKVVDHDFLRLRQPLAKVRQVVTSSPEALSFHQCASG